MPYLYTERKASGGKLLIKTIKQMVKEIVEVLMIVISIGCIVTIVKHLITDK